MLIQQVVHIFLSIPLYHSTRSFQFIIICEENNNKLFYYILKLKKFPNSINIHCKSLIEKYKMNH